MKTISLVTAKQLNSSVASAPRSATPTGTTMQSKKKCINCPPGQNLHRTFAPFCPVWKEAIAQKQQKLQNASEIQNNQTYANIVKTTIKETTPPTKPVINLTEKHHLKYVILILEAHIASIGDGRPYNVILQESLKANNIDAVIPNRDSQKIMDIYSNPKKIKKITSQRNSSVNLALAQMKALMKRNFNLHKRRTKPLH